MTKLSDKLGPYDLDSIITGDARELAKAIPDESVDLIFTDPIYTEMSDYEFVGREAMRVLRPDSAALVWCGIGYLADTLDALRVSGLSYRWTMATRVVARVKFQRCDVGNNIWMCLLWMEKGHMKKRNSSDLITVPYRESNTEISNKWLWGKPIAATTKWLVAFSRPNDMVLDFYGGMGTTAVVAKRTGRHSILFEANEERADRARERVRNTQPPLFVDVPQQMTLEDDP